MEVVGDGEGATVFDLDCKGRKTKSFASSDIFDADETGLFYKKLPHKTLAFKKEVNENVFEALKTFVYLGIEKFNLYLNL